jgi:hypothetical protein
LTLLCEVKQCQEKYESSPRFGNKGNFSYGNISDYKMKMQRLFDEMLKYMEDNNDKQNKFIKMLCDDIHISQKTLGTRYGRMCISSRQTSQGTQRIYTVNTTPLDRTRHAYESDSDSDDDVQKASSRQTASPGANLSIDTDLYEVSNNCMEDSPYLTMTATTVMRSISYVSSSDSASEAEEEDDLTITP